MYAGFDYQPIKEDDSLEIQFNRPFDRLNEGLDLRIQSKEFLIERVLVLERQLKIRNSDCSRLLMDRQALKQRQSVDFPSSHGSVRMHALEQEVKELRQRNKELEYLLSREGKHSNITPMVPSVSLPHSESVSSQNYGSRVTIFNAENGPQVVYDSFFFPDSTTASSPYARSPTRYNSNQDSPLSARDEEERKLRDRLASF